MKNKLPEGWNMMKLIDLAEDISAGGTPSRNKKEYWANGTIPWLKIADMKSVYINKTEEKITKEGLNNSSAKLFPKGTVVYSIFASLGVIGILDIESTTNQAIAGIIPKKNIVSTKYLYYCLQSEKNKILSKKSHATQDNLNLTILRNHEIPLPPLHVQQKIVSILEKAEAAKELRKQADELTDTFLKAVFYEMFGDPVFNKKKFPIKKLSDICDVRDGTHSSPKYVIEGYPLITSKNLTKGYIDFSEVNLISKKDFDEINKRSKVDVEDILMPMIGTIGNPVIVPNNIREFAIKNVALIKFSKSNVSNIYIKYLLDSDYFNYITSGNNRGGTQKFIALGDIRNILIPLPPIELQQKFSSIVQEVEKMKEYQKKSKEQIDDLFNALMQKAFKGELIA